MHACVYKYRYVMYVRIHTYMWCLPISTSPRKTLVRLSFAKISVVLIQKQVP